MSEDALKQYAVLFWIVWDVTSQLCGRSVSETVPLVIEHQLGKLKMQNFYKTNSLSLYCATEDILFPLSCRKMCIGEGHPHMVQNSVILNTLRKQNFPRNILAHRYSAIVLNLMIETANYRPQKQKTFAFGSVEFRFKSPRITTTVHLNLRTQLNSVLFRKVKNKPAKLLLL